MDWSQSLNASPYFDGSNYAFWKARIRAFLYSIDDSVWDAVEIGWTRPEVAKSTWDKTTLSTANTNNKALNAIFCGISLDEFNRISHVTIAKEVWQILETTYEGTKKVKDTKLQMLNTCFEDKWRRVIWLILWEAKWSDDWEIQLGRKDGGLQDCEEDSTIIVREFLCKGHCHKKEPLMRLKFKNLSVPFKPMSFLYHLKGRANLLLLRYLMRDWKLKTSRMRMKLKRMWRTLPRTSVSS